jgi:hypothetical protein
MFTIFAFPTSLCAASCGPNHPAMDAHALDVAKKTGNYELHCESVTAEQISKTHGWSGYSYKVGIGGCEKSDVYTVTCMNADSCEVESSDRVKVKDQP